MDERMEELGSSFFSDFLRNTCGRKSICFEQIFFFCAWIFKSWHIPKRKKKGVDFPAARGARGAFRGRDEKRQEKKRKEKGGKCRRSADQRPLKSTKKNNKWFNEMFICSPKSDFRRGIDFLFSSNFPLFEYSLYTNYSLDWELRKKKQKTQTTP